MMQTVVTAAWSAANEGATRRCSYAFSSPDPAGSGDIPLSYRLRDFGVGSSKTAAGGSINDPP